MSIYQKVESVLFSYPAYDVVRLCKHNGKTNLKAGDELAFEDGSGFCFYINSVASYALSNGKCPIKSYNDAVERGHATHFINQSAVTLSSSSSSKDKAQKIAFNIGMLVHFEGRNFTIESANNNNLKLVEALEL